MSQITAVRRTALFHYCMCSVCNNTHTKQMVIKHTSRLKMSKWTDTSRNVFGMGKLLPLVDERKGGFLPICIPSFCTCNSHRLSETWRGPGCGALSALMMRQLEAIFQLGRALTMKHFRSTLPGLSMTEMDETIAMLTIHSNLIWWLHRPNAILSLTLSYLPWSAEAESGPLGNKCGLSL